MPRDYRHVGRTINKDTSDGPVSTYRGDLFLAGRNIMCDKHNKKIALAAIQGETDSMGCEYIFACQECVDEYLKNHNNEQEMYCEQCGLLKKTKPRRDPEEGSSGRLYNICNECNKQMIDNFCDGEDEY